MAPNDNLISRAVNNGVATAGSYAGGVVDAAGKSVSGAGRGVGDSVTNASNSAGGSASNYGNAVKDWTKAEGPRAQTASNPLGVSGGSYGGKKAVVGGGSKGGAGGEGDGGESVGVVRGQWWGVGVEEGAGGMMGWDTG